MIQKCAGCGSDFAVSYQTNLFCSKCLNSKHMNPVSAVREVASMVAKHTNSKLVEVVSTVDSHSVTFKSRDLDVSITIPSSIANNTVELGVFITNRYYEALIWYQQISKSPRLLWMRLKVRLGLARISSIEVETDG